jgi:hypothetical protein
MGSVPMNPVKAHIDGVPHDTWDESRYREEQGSRSVTCLEPKLFLGALRCLLLGPTPPLRGGNAGPRVRTQNALLAGFIPKGR